ncbi:MAG TPA: hypothetical protein VIR33_12295, partial [Thermopolyspora sp.]
MNRPLPTRDRSSAARPGGRHRRPVPNELSPDAPALVVAAPGDGDEVPAAIVEMLSLDYPQIDVRRVSLADGGDAMAKELTDLAADRPEGVLPAVVAPLVTGPHPKVYRAVREAVA